MFERQMYEVPKGKLRLTSLSIDPKGNLYGLDHFGRVWTLVFFEGQSGWTTVDMDIVGVNVDFKTDKELGSSTRRLGDPNKLRVIKRRKLKK